MTRLSDWHLFRDGLVRGIGWAFGVTIGLALVSSLLVGIFKVSGGIPLVGDFVAGIVQQTQQSLDRNKL